MVGYYSTQQLPLLLAYEVPFVRVARLGQWCRSTVPDCSNPVNQKLPATPLPCGAMSYSSTSMTRHVVSNIDFLFFRSERRPLNVIRQVRKLACSRVVVN
jgi:hypothetical protein